MQGGNPLHKYFTNMKMKNNYIKSRIKRTPTEAGESIEEMLRRLTTNKEPIPQNVPPIYTPMNDGIIPDYDIRADRFDVAIQATDKFSASDIARGAEKGETNTIEKNNENNKED